LLIHYLADAGYDRPISPKILSAPSVKDFQNIFTFLYHQLDPAYVFGPKFDDELPVLIRNLGYVPWLERPSMRAKPYLIIGPHYTRGRTDLQVSVLLGHLQEQPAGRRFYACLASAAGDADLAR